MHRLTLVRHAKSSWADASVGDRDRVLNGRGRRDAVALARFLVDAGPQPDHVLCSSAARTRETLASIAAGFGFDPADADLVQYLDSLYLASADAIAALIDATGMAPDTHLMVVGHNPGLERLAGRLAGDERLDMKSGAVCRFELEPAAAGKLSPASATLLEHATPRG